MIRLLRCRLWAQTFALGLNLAGWRAMAESQYRLGLSGLVRLLCLIRLMALLLMVAILRLVRLLALRLWHSYPPPGGHAPPGPPGGHPSPGGSGDAWERMVEPRLLILIEFSLFCVCVCEFFLCSEYFILKGRPINHFS